MLPTVRAKSVFWASLLCSVFVPGLCQFRPRALEIQLGCRKRLPKNRICRKPVSGELPPKEAARACMVAAEELQKNGHAQQAILLYEKAQNNDPSLKSVSHHLAVLYDAQGDSTRSLAEYNKALESDPKNANRLERLGILLLRAGKLRRSRTVAPQGPGGCPEPSKGADQFGLVLAGQGRFVESFEAFSKVVGPAAAHSNVGVLMAKQGRYDQARQAFHRALAMDPTLRTAQGILGLPRQTTARPLTGSGVGYSHWPVIVAMTVMRMMEMPSDEIVDVVAMRDCLVATTLTVNVSRFMLAAVMARSAGSRVLLADRNDMLCHSAALLLMGQLSLVEIIDVSFVLNLDVPAIETMNVTGLGRRHLLCHNVSSFFWVLRFVPVLSARHYSSVVSLVNFFSSSSPPPDIGIPIAR